MPKAKVNAKSGWKDWVKLLITVLIGIVLGAGVDLAVRPTNTEEVIEIEATTTLELAEEQVEATVVNEEGQEEIVDIPTVEAVDGNQLAEECGEGEECGQGWYVDTSTPQAFRDAVYGLCVDTDGHYGSQCWDLANLFWQNYAGRTLSTCGTGAAKGTLNCYEYNAGSEFEMVWDANSLQAGDIVVFTNGQFGHIGMAMGASNNGYISLLGTNQGGASCAGGGSSANIINISLKNFGGAFRPRSFIKPVEPKPEPVIPITGCEDWNVEQGHTMSLVMLTCEGTVVYGEAMDNYAKSYISQEYMPDKSVYWGWTHGPGIGMWAGDYLIHDISGTHVDPE